MNRIQVEKRYFSFLPFHLISDMGKPLSLSRKKRKHLRRPPHAKPPQKELRDDEAKCKFFYYSEDDSIPSLLTTATLNPNPIFFSFPFSFLCLRHCVQPCVDCVRGGLKGDMDYIIQFQFTFSSWQSLQALPSRALYWFENQSWLHTFLFIRFYYHSRRTSFPSLLSYYPELRLSLEDLWMNDPCNFLHFFAAVLTTSKMHTVTTTMYRMVRFHQQK